MNDFAVPEHNLAIARRVDHIAYLIRTGTPPHTVAEEMQDLAIIMERRI